MSDFEATNIPTPNTSHPLTVFAADWCPYCQRLRAALDSHDIAYDLVDVDAHPEFDPWIKQVNNGNRVVPTVLYSDGTSATNPPVGQIQAKLASL